MRASPLAAVLVAGLLLAAPGTACADGDPASDVLPAQDVFFPYSPTSAPLKATLEATAARARRAGFAVKVALIASRGDLGAYPQMFNDPQRYANLLAAELPTNPHGSVREPPRLLVVMPGGFGGKNLGDGVDRALGPVTIEADAGADGLARAATVAVARLATENGHAVPVPAAATAPAAARGGGSGPSPLVFAVPLALVVLGAVAAGRVAARRGGRGSNPGDQGS